MKTVDFDYHLPPELIAQVPIEKRDESRLLVVDRQTGRLTDSSFAELPQILADAGVTLLVQNDTKVLPARLYGTKLTGGHVEFLFISPQGDGAIWTALSKSSKPLRPGAVITLTGQEKIRILENLGDGKVQVDFGDAIRARKILETGGYAPLPPYIRRERNSPEELNSLDRRRYQTVYAKSEGAVAAPTAGLHFTDEILKRVEEAGIARAMVTLHVGIGTFLPVRVENIVDHKMHEERYVIDESAATKINDAVKAKGRIVAVGTTSSRTLEAAADSQGYVTANSGSTNLFIYPGYRFKVVGGLVTNFHMPMSTLLMLVSAFSGSERILTAYKHAIEQKYRFLSYGDAMVLL